MAGDYRTEPGTVLTLKHEDLSGGFLEGHFARQHELRTQHACTSPCAASGRSMVVRSRKNGDASLRRKTAPSATGRSSGSVGLATAQSPPGSADCHRARRRAPGAAKSGRPASPVSTEAVMGPKGFRCTGSLPGSRFAPTNGFRLPPLPVGAPVTSSKDVQRCRGRRKGHGTQRRQDRRKQRQPIILKHATIFFPAGRPPPPQNQPVRT